MSDIATKTLEVFRVVGALTPEDRRRVFAAVSALCGDSETMVMHPTIVSAPELGGLPPKAARWLTQNKISLERIEDFIHIEDGQSEVILAAMPGRSRREQTTNCYLMAGVGALLAVGEPTVSEAEVVALCKKYKCYDATNHATYRKQSSNFLAGDKDRGFVLSAPGLRAAADVVRST